MEPPNRVLVALWNFLCFIPFFFGLLLLGILKGLFFCPIICLLMTIGNSAIILGLWPAHSIWTYYSIMRASQLGPVLKVVLYLCVTVLLFFWPLLGIVSSIIGGAVYGLLAPTFATFEAVQERRTNKMFHCIYDGTWSTVKKSFTIIRDFMDVCFHSYFSVMDELRCQKSNDEKVYEIRLLYLPGSVLAGVVGIVIDVPMISLIAVCKCPYMLFKGWHRLFHDLIGREGPFLETICVPLAGLAILLWPLAVVGAVFGSMVSSIFLGAYAGVVAYQESSFHLGLCYVVASVSLFDEYSNDVLDMPEGSCFPRPPFRRKTALLSRPNSQAASFSRPSSFRNQTPSRPNSFNSAIFELKPLELFDIVFKECQCYGERMILDGVIRVEDIDDCKSRKGSSGSSNSIVSIGLPAYCLLQTLLRSAKTNTEGLLFSDNVSEMTSSNRPRDRFFDWFLNPLLIMKDQIQAICLSEAEEEHLCKLVLFNGNHERLTGGTAPQSERRQAELDALARRLRGIMVSISRYPTFRRRFECLVKSLHEDLCEENGSGGGDGESTIPRLRLSFSRLLTQKSVKSRPSDTASDQDILQTA